MGIIELSPSRSQVVAFLSQHICPKGEISGISWMKLHTNGVFEYQSVRELATHLDPEIKVSITDDNVVALAARTGKTQIFDMAEMFAIFKQATHKEGLSSYASGIVLPITDRIFVGVVMNTPFEKLSAFSEYFECVRLVLALWQSREEFHKSKLANEEKMQEESLTERQKVIVIMIQEGKTNASIAELLGFSESLIRQETIIIYRKLGIHGRRDLLSQSEG